MQYSYEITPRPAELGSGWKLRLLHGDVEMGGGMFPIDYQLANLQDGMSWWKALDESERIFWLKVADSEKSADAYHSFLLALAYDEAKREGCAWLKSRGA